MRSVHIVSSLFAAGLLMSGCDNNTTNLGALPSATNGTPAAANVVGANNPVAEVREYKVRVKNLTLAQPMSPLLVAYHAKDTVLYTIGTPASVGLEKLAESGDNTALLAQLSQDAQVESSSSGTGVFGPGNMTEVTVNGEVAECISVASMLVNTNDAFIATNCVNVSSLTVGASLTKPLSAYDAGTEKNDEEAANIPGPAGGGEGFNAQRDDRDFVASHGGVVTADDGLSISALTQKHKWGNPAAELIIERIK